MRAHQIMRIVRCQRWHGLSFKALEQIQSLSQQSIAFDPTAVILHCLGNCHIQLFPVHTVFLISIQTFLLCLYICAGKLCQPNGLCICGCLTACIISRRTSKSSTVRRIKLIACSLKPTKMERSFWRVIL